mmetsp:Transcript_76238/g.123207  ORF Transcript_76238/g.123207 Transcript_76238/m.123207 type:complete len:145 (-) Transcript_76238:684-1118(-)
MASQWQDWGHLPLPSLGSLLMESCGVRMLIKENTTIIAKMNQTSTNMDNQPYAVAQALLSKPDMIKNSETPGMFYLRGIPTAFRGDAQFEVTSMINAYSILNVIVLDESNCENNRTTITDEKNSAETDEFENTKNKLRASSTLS